jgi:hypothetical protein
MVKNIGSLDQLFRLVAGLVIIALGVLYQSWWGLLGVIFLLTGTIKWCPLYLPFGISTCKTKTEKK